MNRPSDLFIVQTPYTPDPWDPKELEIFLERLKYFVHLVCTYQNSKTRIFQFLSIKVN